MERGKRIHPADLAALLFSLLAVFAGFWVNKTVFEGMAHLEDEMAYLWQAQAIAGGELAVPSPPGPKSFLVPFVVDYNGLRFGKYPLGWPVVLAMGEVLNLRSLVNPLLGGFGVWLTYVLGRKLFGRTTGLFAAGLTVTSPFFLVNTGSLLSHPLGLVLSAGFALAWLDAFTEPLHSRPWLPTLAGAAALGLLALSRPMSAIGVAIPFGLHGLYLLVRGEAHLRVRLAILGLIVAAIAGLHFLWQYSVTGDPFLNPYTLWWPYDKIGFGPGYGHSETGHTLRQAWINTRFSLEVGRSDLFGWPYISWLFMPFGLIAVVRDRNWRSLLPISVILSLGVIYLAYWIGSSLFGPRYYYEGFYSLTLVSAAGIAWTAGWPTGPGESFLKYSGRRRLRPLAVTFLIVLLTAGNFLLYTPKRLSNMYGLYGVQRSHLEPFLTADAARLTPALIIVHTMDGWIEYGTLHELQNPFLNTPFIFGISRGPRADAELARSFPDRRVYHYYPKADPFTFFPLAKSQP